MKNFILCFLLTLIPSMVCAHDFERDGIYYNILSDSTVEVTFQGTNRYSMAYSRTSPIIPMHVEYNGNNYEVIGIGNNAFNMCNLTGIELPSSIKYIGRNSFWENGIIASTINLPEGLEFIGSGAFFGCPSLTTITLPKTLKVIDNSAFYGTFITSVSIPSSVDSIYSSAFSSCPHLESIRVENKDVYIERNPFFGSLWETKQPDGPLVIDGIVLDFKGDIPDDKTLVIPEGCYQISSHAFYNNKDFEHVQFPKSLRIIREGAFKRSSLKEVTLNEGLMYIKPQAFYYCEYLETATFNCPLLDSISSECFTRCENLKSVIFIDNIQRIGNYSFWQCSNLSYIKLPKHLKTIGENAFGLCYLDLVEFNNELKTIESMAFEGNNLKRIVLPSSLDSICSSAFSSNRQATYLDIPSSLDYIGSMAFSLLSEVDSIIVHWDEPYEGANLEDIDNRLYNTNEIFSSWEYYRATLYVPLGSKTKYEAIDIWNKFERIVEIGEDNALDEIGENCKTHDSIDIWGKKSHVSTKGFIIQDNKVIYLE